MVTIELVSVYNDPAAYGLLHDLLAERTPEQSVSHKKMPMYSEHIEFVDSKPYRAWYLVIEESDGYVGAVYLTELNEIGVSIFRAHQGKGYGTAAVQSLMKKHKPLPAIPSKRVGTFIANMNPENEASRRLFKKLGFKKVQETHAL